VATDFIGVSAGKARQLRIGLASLNNSSRLCGLGAIPSCLVFGIKLI
jgi:hypothetical protein